MRRTTVVAAASLIVYLCLSNWLFPSHSMAFRDNSALSLQSSSRDVKNGTMSSHVPRSCQRVCSSRPNRIVLDSAGFGKHGLGSRMSIFRAMGNLAGYFCANLLVAPPKAMLSKKHNRGQEFSADLRWGDFFDYRFSDGTLAISQYTAMPSPPESSVVVRTKIAKNIISHMQRLEAVVDAQMIQTSGLSNSSTSSFTWEVYASIYSWRSPVNKWLLKKDASEAKKIIPSLENDNDVGCDYVERTPSKVSILLRDKVFDRIHSLQPSSTTLGNLHIRRGDSIEACDTSLPVIHDFVACSFSNQAAVSQRYGRVSILLASDEWDECYRSAICEILQSGFGMGCVDLDKLILDVLLSYIAESGTGAERLNNNMFIYYLSMLVSSDERIQIHLEKRRDKNCPACIDVLSGESSNSQLNRDRYQGGIREPDWDIARAVARYNSCIGSA